MCSHSVSESSAFAQQGYELLPANVPPLSTALPTLVCGGCGRYLKKTYPQLLLRETEEPEVFQCMLWRTQDGMCCEEGMEGEETGMTEIACHRAR